MKNKKIIGTTITGTVICFILGCLFFGLDFNDFMRPPVYFLILGFSGSLTFILFREGRIRDAIYANLIVFALFAFIASAQRPITALILFIYYSALVLSLYVYVKNFDARLSGIVFVRPLVLAALVGLFYVMANVVHGLLFITEFSMGFLLGNLPIGFMLGFGYGLAGEISDWYLS